MNEWPRSEIQCDEDVVLAEKRKVIVSHVAQVVVTPPYFRHFSSLNRVVRMIAWIRRWKGYRRNVKDRPKELTQDEVQQAEICLWRMVQSEVFSSSEKLTQMNAFQDETEHVAVERLIEIKNIETRTIAV